MEPHAQLENGNLLLCPKCGFNYLHHGAVEVFVRDGEDSDIGTRVKVDGHAVTFGRNLRGNPSSRRDGLTVDFQCEECRCMSVLSIVQHKGQTFVEWESA